MAVPTQLSDLSATAASNSPAGSDTVGTTMDDFLRAHASIIARIAAGTDALSSPDINGGTIDGAVIGGTTRAAVSGTTGNFNGGLTVTGAAFTSRGITDNATATALTLSGSGANRVTIANSAGNPTIGTSAGSLQVNAFNGSSLQVAEFASSASAVNYLKFQNRDTGVGPIIWAEGADTNIPLELRSKGSGSILLITGGASGSGQAAITHTASATRYLTLTGATAGGNPTISTSAGDLLLSSAGGSVCFGTYSAKGAEAFAGYITIKDAAGNSRKVMVCA